MNTYRNMPCLNELSNAMKHDADFTEQTTDTTITPKSCSVQMAKANDKFPGEINEGCSK